MATVQRDFPFPQEAAGGARPFRIDRPRGLMVARLPPRSLRLAAWVAAAWALGPAWAGPARAGKAAGDCSLSALRIWAEGSRLQLEPDFAPTTLEYHSLLDLRANSLWVEAIPSGPDGCRARRSDQWPDGNHVAVSAAGSDGVVKRKYTVRLARRSGDSPSLAALSLSGTSSPAPPFEPDSTEELSVEVQGEGDAVAVACSPMDMGQGVSVSFGVSRSPLVVEKPLDLEAFRRRVRTFPLGTAVLGGTRLQLPGTQASVGLPLLVLVSVWPAASSPAVATGASGVAVGAPGFAPARVYKVLVRANRAGRRQAAAGVAPTLQPLQAEVRLQAANHGPIASPAVAVSPATRGAIGGLGRGRALQQGVFGAVLGVVLLGMIMAAANCRAWAKPGAGDEYGHPDDCWAAYSTAGPGDEYDDDELAALAQAQDEVQNAFDVAREPPMPSLQGRGTDNGKPSDGGTAW